MHMTPWASACASMHASVSRVAFDLAMHVGHACMHAGASPSHDTACSSQPLAAPAAGRQSTARSACTCDAAVTPSSVEHQRPDQDATNVQAVNGARAPQRGERVYHGMRCCLCPKRHAPCHTCFCRRLTMYSCSASSLFSSASFSMVSCAHTAHRRPASQACMGCACAHSGWGPPFARSTGAGMPARKLDLPHLAHCSKCIGAS